jgi:hypothetical protein
MDHRVTPCPGPAGLGAGLCVLLVFCFAPRRCAAKDYLTISSQPPGATLEIDGLVVGKTPYTAEIPGGYLRGEKSLFGKVLRHQMHVRLSLAGYFSAEADLANGPAPWVGFIGTYRGDYWTLKANTFDFTLEQARTSFSGFVQAILSDGSPATLEPAMSTEEIVKRDSPAVLYLSGPEEGSGFLITDTGVAVTNAHVIAGRKSVTATVANGQNVTCEVVYVDNVLDVAILKLEGTGFPSLRLAAIQTVQL